MRVKRSFEEVVLVGVGDGLDWVDVVGSGDDEMDALDGEGGVGVDSTIAVDAEGNGDGMDALDGVGGVSVGIDGMDIAGDGSIDSATVGIVGISGICIGAGIEVEGIGAAGGAKIVVSACKVGDGTSEGVC